jgi:hypothetical protein
MSPDAELEGVAADSVVQEAIERVPFRGAKGR